MENFRMKFLTTMTARRLSLLLLVSAACAFGAYKIGFAQSASYGSTSTKTVPSPNRAWNITIKEHWYEGNYAFISDAIYTVSIAPSSAPTQQTALYATEDHGQPEDQPVVVWLDNTHLQITSIAPNHAVQLNTFQNITIMYFYTTYHNSIAPVMTPTPMPPPPSTHAMSWKVIDYFTKQPVSNAVSSLNAVTVSSTTPGAFFALITGLTPLRIAASGYATYNGALDPAAAVSPRTIALFPISSAMQAWLNQINTDRAASGTSNKLQLDDALTIVAFDHAADMSSKHYAAYSDPASPAGDGLDPMSRRSLLGVEPTALGRWSENIAQGYASWQAAESAFITTKTNCSTTSSSYCTVVDPSAVWVGLGIAQTSGGALAYDQAFSTAFIPSDTVKTGVLPPTTGSPLPPEYFNEAWRI